MAAVNYKNGHEGVKFSSARPIITGFVKLNNRTPSDSEIHLSAPSEHLSLSALRNWSTAHVSYATFQVVAQRYVASTPVTGRKLWHWQT